MALDRQDGFLDGGERARAGQRLQDLFSLVCANLAQTGIPAIRSDHLKMFSQNVMSNGKAREALGWGESSTRIQAL